MTFNEFQKLLKTMPYRSNYQPTEDVYTYPDGGSFYVRLNPKDNPDGKDIVATGKAIEFAQVCLGDTNLTDAKDYPLWRTLG